jgi:hypothetical protein
MLGLFKSRPHDDATLGRLTRSWGLWRGTINVDGRAAPLALAGASAAPDANALDIARALPAQLNSLRPAIERELFEHCAPYLEAIRSGELDEPERADILRIAKPADTWAFVEAKALTVKPLAGHLTAELALTSAWDEEHTFGVYIRDGRLVEFNASIAG